MVRRDSSVLQVLSALIPLIITVYFFLITSSEDVQVQSFILFGIIAVSSFIYVLYISWKDRGKMIEGHSADLVQLEKDLNVHKLFEDLSIRLGVVENMLKKKKAQIDPKLFYWILMIILLYLFLKSFGVFP
tara:strand:+ start:49 stop:441 length:393 start_codon:yes stop_codon:yes gene_type:complete